MTGPYFSWTSSKGLSGRCLTAEESRTGATASQVSAPADELAQHSISRFVREC
jgi:hypothetical protein